MTTSLSDLASRIGGGLLSFPVTHFGPEGALDIDAYQGHVARQADAGAVALFAAGGTGEFFSLTLEEYGRVVSAAVEAAEGRVPVIAGCGYGTAMAVEFARSAADSGAAAILLLPPYLMNAEQAGLVRHVQAVANAIDIGVILYGRDNGIYTEASVARLADTCPNLIGYKDGVGDLDALTRIVKGIGDRLVYVGGVPTAEMLALPYFSIGVSTYSSAVYNFLPDLACRFYDAARDGDTVTVNAILHDFFFPYIALRNRAKGYAVSIVKAGMRIVGQPAGPVRPPLIDLTSEEAGELARLVDVGRRLGG